MSVNEKMTAIADVIRGYTGRSDKLSLEGMATGVSEVFGVGNNEGYNKGREEGLSEGRTQGYGLGFEEGKAAERNDFWEVFQKGGTTKVVYNNAFSYGKFNDDNYNPKYDILVTPGTATADQMFYNSPLTSTKKPIYNECTRLQNTFTGCTQMVEIPYLHLLETTTFNGAFTSCTRLITLIIGGTIGQNGFNVQWSKKLNKASIESIINALSATTSGLTVTFSKTAVNNAFETAKGAADGSTSAEWIALAGNETIEGIRPNWNISLM